MQSISAREATEEALSILGEANVVIVCVSIKHYLATLKRLLPHLSSQTVLVDVATVKVETTAWLQQHGDKLNYVATHPMFGPSSYKKSGNSVTGFRLVVTDHNIPVETYEKLLSWLECLGMRVIGMDAESHDKYLAETLFLTHFIAQAITAADFVRTDIDTVSFGFLMDAVESVREDTDLFNDVFHHNPYCESIINRLIEAVQQTQQRLKD